MSMEGLSPERFAEVDAVFDAALDLDDEAREALLAEHPDAAPIVRELLGHAEATGLDPAAEVVASMALELADHDPLPGQTLGPYTVDDVIGEGGMGRVYAAHRSDGAFERAVAIKVIRRGLDTDRMLRRFWAEREILAGLDHPSITRLLDGGAMIDGRPYLVMELVTGEPCLEYAARLSIRERLTLFVQICRAVAYAHERMVIHRDIKPANVRVREDGTPVLMDFGIAKVLHHAHTDTEVTEAAFTPRWAAPEQRAGRPISVRTDVFALGLLLHAMLGAPAGLPRDLHAIHTKATRDDPQLRYASASALADEVERHLRGEAVQARPERLYRAARFARRHRLAVFGGTLAIILLLSYAVSMTLLSRQLERERNRAQAQAEKNRVLSRHLADALQSNSDEAVAGGAITVPEALDRTASRIDDVEAPDETLAALHLVTARAYLASGEAAAATREALAAVRLEPASSAARLEALDVIVHARAGSSEWAGAREAAWIALVQALADDTGSLSNLGRALRLVARAHRQDAAIAVTFHALSLPPLIVGGGPWHLELARAVVGLGDACGASLGVPLLRWGLAIYRDLEGPDGAAVADTLQKLARHLPPEEGVAPMRAALEIERRIFGEHHSWTLNTLNDLGLMLSELDPDAAIDLARQAWTIVDATRSPGDPQWITFRVNLGALLIDHGRLAEGDAHLEAALDEASRAPPSQRALVSYHAGLMHARRGETARARALLEQAQQIAQSLSHNHLISRAEDALAAL